MIAELADASAAFLVAVLVADLTFDLPVLAARDSTTAASALARATGYYAQITARGSPLALAAAVAMIGLCGALSVDLWRATVTVPRLAHAALAAAPVVLALVRTLPNAKRLATGEGDPRVRTARARAIARDHLAALVAMGTFLALQILGAT